MRRSAVLILGVALSCSADPRVESVESAKAQIPHSRMFGRVLNVSGTPLQGVRVSFSPVRDAWTRGAAPSDFASGGQNGIECATDAAGRFACSAPVPTAEAVVLKVEPGRFHQRAMREFGKGGTAVTPRLVAGDNDLGDFVLQPAGAVTGFVVDPDGKPVADTTVSVARAEPGGVTVTATSDGDGLFQLEGVPPGTWLLEASRDGFVKTKSERVKVATNAVTEGPRITMARASLIAGRVVDDAGLGVPNAHVTGYANGGGFTCHATTAADGSFRVVLNRHVGHSFEVRALACEMHQGAEVYRPGTTDVRIVMAKFAMGTFRVVDAATNAPIEDYRLIFSDMPVDERSILDWAPHHFPSGVARWPAEPGKSYFRVHAPGYAPLDGPVQWNGDTPRTQILRMRRPTGVPGA